MLTTLGVVLVIGAVSFIVAMMIQAFGSRIIAEEIVLDTLPQPFDGFRVLFITDIHRRRLPSTKLSVLKGKVDVVLVGGDLTERNSPLQRLGDNMTLLASIAPLYVVYGNHDYNAATVLIDDIIRGKGGHVLLNEHVPLYREDAAIWLTGVDYPHSGGKRPYASLPPLPDNTQSVFRLLLVHDPFWLALNSEVPADLVLAGHTHGGQIVLPLIGKRHVERFYRAYDAGMFQWPQKGGGFAKVLISRGFGTSHLPLRWGSPAEMHIITLRRNPKQHASD
ncbi:metallophosphoesterase [Paenibacillus sp. sgz500958]|uniref:metallophosphoesterase n=1 Tax=Paenibacillus sp. sgz500958 TaxID=3242475 RepID=UPI0036D40BE3